MYITEYTHNILESQRQSNYPQVRTSFFKNLNTKKKFFPFKMTIVLNNITDETIGIIKWQGSISLILIGILVIFGCVGLVIKAMFVSFIAQNSSKDRPINLLILIDQVRSNFLYFTQYFYQILLRKFQFYQMDV